jgi:hypothetical protein
MDADGWIVGREADELDSLEGCGRKKVGKR